jgi:dethiobiotin synthetase
VNPSTKPDDCGKDHSASSNTRFQETAFQEAASDPSPARVSLAAHHVSANNVVKALLITGTDTNVGKTWVTCLIARQLMACGLRVAAYKPVCSGAIITSTMESSGPLAGTSPANSHVIWEDVECLKAAIGEEWSDEIICPQRFLAPLAPPIAAKAEGRTVDFLRMLSGAYQFPGADVLLIEGAGGWLSPLTEQFTVADVAAKLRAPVLIVARAGLGTINHTLLTIESIRHRGLEIAGVVLNEPRPTDHDASTATNAEEIERRSGIPVFGILPHGGDPGLLRGGIPVTMEWMLLAKPLAEPS